MFSVFCVNKKFSTDKLIQNQTESRTFALLDTKKLVSVVLNHSISLSFDFSLSLSHSLSLSLYLSFNSLFSLYLSFNSLFSLFLFFKLSLLTLSFFNSFLTLSSYSLTFAVMPAQKCNCLLMSGRTNFQGLLQVTFRLKKGSFSTMSNISLSICLSLSLFHCLSLSKNKFGILE